MPITPQQIKDRKATTTFTFAGESVTVTYHAALVENLTQAQVEGWTEQANALETEDAAQQFVAGLVCAYVESWDCVESIAEDGALGPMIPLTVERVAPLDARFLGQVLVELVKDAAGGKSTGTA